MKSEEQLSASILTSSTSDFLRKLPPHGSFLCYTARKPMLQHLHIENYALIDSLDIEFRSGLNLLSGETGSGKSIVVDAVGLLLGDKASSESIRSGAERARITGVFSAAPSSHSDDGRWERLLAFLAESGMEAPEGEDVVLQRDILPGGKSRVFLNHQPATVGLCKSMASYLAEVHGQNEQQELFSPSAQLQMLDRFGSLVELAAPVRERFEVWKSLRATQEDLIRCRQERLRQMDLWQFQKLEIEQAGIAAGEDQRLEEERLLLTHAARIQSPPGAWRNPRIRRAGRSGQRGATGGGRRG